MTGHERRLTVAEFEHGLPGDHALRVIHVQADHRAGDFAGYLHHVTVDVGIVGGLVVPSVEEPVRRVAHTAQHDHGGQASERPTARAAGGLGGLRFGCH